MPTLIVKPTRIEAAGNKPKLIDEYIGVSNTNMHLRACAGSLPPPVMEAIRVVPVGKGIAGLAVERAEPVNLCNLQTDGSGAARPAARSTGVQGTICVPIMAGGKAVGALGIGTYREHTFTEDEIALLLEAGRTMGRKLWNS